MLPDPASGAAGRASPSRPPGRRRYPATAHSGGPVHRRARASWRVHSRAGHACCPHADHRPSPGHARRRIRVRPSTSLRQRGAGRHQAARSSRVTIPVPPLPARSTATRLRHAQKSRARHWHPPHRAPPAPPRAGHQGRGDSRRECGCNGPAARPDHWDRGPIGPSAPVAPAAATPVL